MAVHSPSLLSPTIPFETTLADEFLLQVKKERVQAVASLCSAAIDTVDRVREARAMVVDTLKQRETVPLVEVLAKKTGSPKRASPVLSLSSLRTIPKTDHDVVVEKTASTFRVTLVGLGYVGRTLARALLESGAVAESELVVSTRTLGTHACTEFLSRSVTVLSNNSQAVEGASVVFLTCLPSHFPTVVSETRNSLPSYTLVVSCMIGAPTRKIERALNARAVFAMGQRPVVRTPDETRAFVDDAMSRTLYYVARGMGLYRHEAEEVFGHPEEAPQSDESALALASKNTGSQMELIADFARLTCYRSFATDMPRPVSSNKKDIAKGGSSQSVVSTTITP